MHILWRPLLNDSLIVSVMAQLACTMHDDTKLHVIVHQRDRVFLFIKQRMAGEISIMLYASAAHGNCSLQHSMAALERTNFACASELLHGDLPFLCIAG